MYMKARDQGASQTKAAALVNISERSAQRIESGSHQPKRGKPRDWRTRSDPLEEVWISELEPMLRDDPRLKPTTLFEYLQEHHPGKYPQVLRTLQRRVHEWKALHGPSPEVMFELRHEPGVMGISDFTELKQIKVTIKGKPFEHLIYHYRLAYSGWQYAQIIQGGESFIALSEGLQNALFASGGSPKQHRTDSLSAAYRNSGGKGKQLTRLYTELCEHYRLEATRNNTGIAHENGAIESPHGHLKNRIRQQIYLRGSSDFESIRDYQTLIHKAVDKLNERCQERFIQEQSYLQPLPSYRVADYEVLTVRVSRRSTIDVRCILYTVPSRLIGHRLELHLYHDHIDGYLGRQLVVELPRIRVNTNQTRRGHCINYRHVIEGLRRKPRAFIYCTWQSDLLPNDHYRELWEQLKRDFTLDRAAVLMVEALYLAATQDKESAVAHYLEDHLTASTLSLSALRCHFHLPPNTDPPTLCVQQHSLNDYDQLLDSPLPLSNPQYPSQNAAPLPHAQSMGNS